AAHVREQPGPLPLLEVALRDRVEERGARLRVARHQQYVGAGGTRRALRGTPIPLRRPVQIAPLLGQPTRQVPGLRGSPPVSGAGDRTEQPLRRREVAGGEIALRRGERCPLEEGGVLHRPKRPGERRGGTVAVRALRQSLT